VLCALCGSYSLAADDIAESLNAVRSRGCEGRAGLAVALKRNTELDAVAREWSRGGRLRDALARTDYRMINSSSMFVQGTKDTAVIVRTLSKNYCGEIVDPDFTEIGFHQQQDKTWVVVAKPFNAPAPGDAARISARALELVNAARARARKCGNSAFAAVPPLRLDPLLQKAALAHAQDMAKHSRFDHQGSDGSRPAQRATRAGYPWRNVGENIAAGAPTIEDVVQGWLESPGHCANIMSPQFKEMGIAYISAPKSKADIYWAQVFGTKR
jgi:uncharacterized protein YkwD